MNYNILLLFAQAEEERGACFPARPSACLKQLLLNWFSSLSDRFRVKQPPPQTGLRVMYAPGPVGYADDLLGFFFFARCSWPSGHLGVLSHQLSGNRAGRVHDLFKIIWSLLLSLCCLLPSTPCTLSLRACARMQRDKCSVESSRSSTEVKDSLFEANSVTECSHCLEYLLYLLCLTPRLFLLSWHLWELKPQLFLLLLALFSTLSLLSSRVP